jgi:hypothetical protein
MFRKLGQRDQSEGKRDIRGAEAAFVATNDYNSRKPTSNDIVS